MVEQRADRSGQALGPYQLTRLLGNGGFGEVYEADHRLLQQKRAIKLLLERHLHDPKQRERFLRETRTLATLEHPNVLPVLEVGEEGRMLYLVMPFYHRGTLNDLLKPRTTPLPLTEVERFLAQMCAAVGYAHTRNIAHLDLKPDNMLLHDDGRLIVSDFGLAHLVKQGQLEGGSSLSMGTPHYMAPEQFRGKPELRSDLYALGVILYQLLTNQRPFTGNAPEAVMMKHLLEAPPPLHVVSPQAPAMLEPVIQKALEKKPENRYATAEALLTDFHIAVSSSLRQPIQPSVSGMLSTETKSHIVDQTGVIGLFPGTISAPLASIPPAPLTATQLARGVPFTPTSPLVQRNFPVSSMQVAPPGGAKQKKLSKTSSGLIFLLTLLFGIGWVWLSVPLLSLILGVDTSKANFNTYVCGSSFPSSFIPVVFGLLFPVCLIIMMIGFPVSLSALIIGLIKTLTNRESKETLIGLRALAAVVSAVIIGVLIRVWFTQGCYFR